MIPMAELKTEIAGAHAFRDRTETLLFGEYTDDARTTLLIGFIHHSNLRTPQGHLVSPGTASRGFRFRVGPISNRSIFLKFNGRSRAQVIRRSTKLPPNVASNFQEPKTW